MSHKTNEEVKGLERIKGFKARQESENLARGTVTVDLGEKEGSKEACTVERTRSETTNYHLLVSSFLKEYQFDADGLPVVDKVKAVKAERGGGGFKRTQQSENRLYDVSDFEIGELVEVLYPYDQKWYPANVITKLKDRLGLEEGIKDGWTEGGRREATGWVLF